MCVRALKALARLHECDEPSVPSAIKRLNVPKYKHWQIEIACMLSCCCMCLVSLPRALVGRFVVCDCFIPVRIHLLLFGLVTE